MLEGDYFINESYLLVHQCGFSYSDVLQLTFKERSAYIKMRVEESDREKAEMESSQSK